jgi:DNA replication protein DnaC
VSRGVVVADLIRTSARALKMPGLARAFEGLARQAREEHWSPEDYLRECLAVELASRTESAVKQRLRAAAFPELKTLDEFELGVAEGVSAAQLAELARGDWVSTGQNVLLAGPIGTGKTHLAIALGIEAARQRRRVAFWRAADLVRTLVEARDAKELGRYQRRLERVDLMICDELGFVPFDRQGGELLFNLFAARHGRRSVCITTNLAFSEWPRVFGGDEKLTTALLDRLAEHAIVITTKGKSYRMRKRRAGEALGGNASAEEPAGDGEKKVMTDGQTKKSRPR